jgi:DNA-binding transcriptional regulator LsrR (DeoR family)
LKHQDLMIRTSWLYHVEGLTQAQIGDRMNLTRRRVNELLAVALEEGVVRISFSARLADNVELETKLCERFGLEDAIVVPTPVDPALLHASLGRGAAAYLDRLIEARQPQAIGVGWGATLRETVRHVSPRNAPHLDIHSMMGGLTRGSEINTFEIVRNFAQVLNAQCHYFAAPIYAGSRQSREAIISQPVFQEVFQAICNVDISYLSVGDVTSQSLQVKYGLPLGTDVQHLIEAGAVGDLLGRYLDIEGHQIEHPLNDEVISPQLENYQKIPCRIIASGGTHKQAILKAVLNAQLATVIVTDSDNAKALL